SQGSVVVSICPIYPDLLRKKLHLDKGIEYCADKRESRKQFIDGLVPVADPAFRNINNVAVGKLKRPGLSGKNPVQINNYQLSASWSERTNYPNVTVI